MVTQKITLNNPERFFGTYTIPRQKLEQAAEIALERLKNQYEKYGAASPGGGTVIPDHKYVPGTLWCDGLCNGMFWIAYEMTGDKFWREAAESQYDYFKNRLDGKIGLYDHDVGFVFTPSFVAGYKITGNEKMRQAALEACEFLYSEGFSQKGGFIIRSFKSVGTPAGCRTMMDTMMNIPLLFWGAQESGDERYYKAAMSQCEITEKYLMREDGSTNHHYQFDVETHKPVGGVTLQGHSDDSCWSRGHSWGIYGFPIAYTYSHEPRFFETCKNLTYFMLNHLPEDLVPYWDYDFMSGRTARDSSAGAIAVCGMHEMAKHLPDDDVNKAIYQNAAAQMLEALIDHCTEPPIPEADGILFKTCPSLPHGHSIASAMYGNHFYLDALMRFLHPDWETKW